MPVSGVDGRKDFVAIDIPPQNQLESVGKRKDSSNLEKIDGFTPAPPPAPIVAKRKVESTPIRDGIAAGFAVGSCLSIIGIPVVVVTIAESQGKISSQTAKKINEFLVPLTFPGLLVGLVGSVVGGLIGGGASIVKKMAHLLNNHMKRNEAQTKGEPS